MRLRFDRVAVRVVRGVRDALAGAVPEGLCVVFSVTAPVREPAKTIASIVRSVRGRLVPGAWVETVCGNTVRVRVVTRRLPAAAPVVGFVHNPDPPPDALLDVAQALLECTQTGGSDPDLLRQVQAQVCGAGQTEHPSRKGVG